MKTDDEVEIYISTTTGWVKWARVTVTGVALLYAPIAIGIACDSLPMQWAGFTLGLLMLYGYARTANSQTTFKSTAEARAYLDKIDAGTAP